LRAMGAGSVVGGGGMEGMEEADAVGVVGGFM
jgi:hypothetical protein